MELKTIKERNFANTRLVLSWSILCRRLAARQNTSVRWMSRLYKADLGATHRRTLGWSYAWNICLGRTELYWAATFSQAGETTQGPRVRIWHGMAWLERISQTQNISKQPSVNSPHLLESITESGFPRCRREAKVEWDKLWMDALV